jgi:hypothetical protein
MMDAPGATEKSPATSDDITRRGRTENKDERIRSAENMDEHGIMAAKHNQTWINREHNTEGSHSAKVDSRRIRNV